jgi:F-type H+-transporting ATPase subunit b
MRIFFILIVAYLAIKVDLFAAEAGMPQLDPTYWASQAFWLILVFTVLYISIAKFYLPKIKKNLDDRENKIKEDLDEAQKLKNLAEQKHKEYELSIENAKKEVQKIIFESKSKLNLEIQNKKKKFEKEIEIEIESAEKEIENLKKESLKNISTISEEMASKVIEQISGEPLNQSSIKAAILETTKNNLGKYL